MAVKYLKIRFNLEKELDKRAFNYILNSGKSASMCVIQLANDKLENQNNEKLLDRAVNMFSDRVNEILKTVQYDPVKEKEEDIKKEELLLELMDFFD